MPTIAWLPWSADAFAQARDECKPVLLSIVTAWSQSCRDMDETTYADPAVARLVDEAFVPVRVDADRRPDISERYSLGGWPTTAFLTSDGAIAGGGTFVARDRMAAVLQQGGAGFRDAGGRGVAARPLQRRRRDAGRSSGAVSPCPRPGSSTSCSATFDEEFGGFGIAPKFPLDGADPSRAGPLSRGRRPRCRGTSPRDRSRRWGGGRSTTRATAASFAAPTSATGRHPHREKLLEVNAALIGLYVDASEVLGYERYADRAHDALRYAQNWLADQVDGGWASAQHDDREYYDAQAAGFDGRRVRPAGRSHAFRELPTRR